MTRPLRDGDTLPAVEHLRAALHWLSEGLLERDDHARALLLAALSGEHILLIGPPGTAKSALARRLHQLVGGHWFERLLTRFTVPEELFGPLSLTALDEGRYERELAGYLPTADVAFLDEVFKANSAILNSLLGILNERTFDQGASRIAVPLACLVGASNELPDDESMRAFQDRFLFRCQVVPVSDAAFRNLLSLAAGPGPAPPWQISRAALDHIDAQASQVVVSNELLDALVALRASLLEAGLVVSDRRWVRAVRVLRVAALLDRSGEAGLEYLPVLKWLLPESRSQIVAFEQWMLGYLGVDRRLDPVWLERAAQAFAQQLEIEQSAGELAFDDSGKLAMARQVGGADPSALSADAPRLSAFSRARRYSRAHIDARVAQISALIGRVDSWLAEADDQSRALQSRLGRVLWLGHGVAQAAGDTFEASMASVRGLRVRLESVRAGFTALPLADLDNGLTPEPVNLDEVS
jgi:MoxR-like ATPase